MPARLVLLLLAAAAAGFAPRSGAADPPARPALPTKYWVFLGTYTGAKSKGIYRCELDIATGKLSAPELAAEMTNPTFLAVGEGDRTLYAVEEVSGLGPRKNEGRVAAFTIDHATGALTKVGERLTGGAGPCHVGVGSFGRCLAVSNYTGGSWKLFGLDALGRFTDAERFFPLAGSGPRKGQQDAPHAHCARFGAAAGDRVFVADLGSDRVWVTGLKFAPGGAGPPAAEEQPPLVLPPGTGPRHIAVGAFDRLYVCGEIDSTLHVLDTSPQLGGPKLVQTLSTLPGGKPVKGNSTAEVKLNDLVSGRYVYVSNRGHNSIAVFKADNTLRLSPAGHATSPDVKMPRNFNIVPGYPWMLVASQDGDNVAVFKIDAESGMPAATGDKVAVGKPVCVVFTTKLPK